MTYGEVLRDVVEKKENYHPKEILEPKLSKETKFYTMTTYVLELNEEEAKWLRSVMQNPLWGQTPAEEENYDSDMRGAFFNAVKNAGMS